MILILALVGVGLYVLREAISEIIFESGLMAQFAIAFCCLMMGGMLASMKYVLEGLVIDAPQMRANLDRLGGFLLSERVMFVLSEKVGKQTAHELVYEASMHGIEQGVSFEKSLMENKKVRDALTVQEVRAVLDPVNYLGHAPAIVDCVVAEQRAKGWMD